MLCLLLAAVGMLNVLLVHSGLPKLISNLVDQLQLGPSLFLLLMTLTILIAGFFAEALALLFIVTPMFLPTALMLGISPIQLGPLVVLGILIGQITPPMGPLLYFASKIFDVPAPTLFRACIPYLLVEVAVMIIVIFWHPLTMWLPSLL